MIKTAGDDFKLVVVIVKKNLSRKVIKACRKGGSEGGTVMQGRGTGKKEIKGILGVEVEPEKDIILSLTPNEKVDSVMHHITKCANLNKPGTGVAFIINSKSICGVAHLLDDDFSTND